MNFEKEIEQFYEWNICGKTFLKYLYEQKVLGQNLGMF